MERTIKVTGKGKLSIKPDTIRLIVSLEGMKKEYSDVIHLSSEMSEKIKDIFEQQGFEKSMIRTLSFDVKAEYENYQDRDNSWKRRFTGYKFTHRMKVEFPVDNKRLGKILYALGHAPLCPEIQLEYTIADIEKSKNELLASAVSDSAAKAAVLAKAAGVSLGEILNIDYSWTELDFVSRPMRGMALEERCMLKTAECGGSYDIDIEADDINVTDNVTVVWKIGS